jgi:hypothetical protein
MTPDIERQMDEARGNWNIESVSVALDFGARVIAIVVPTDAAGESADADWGLVSEPMLVMFIDNSVH